MTDFNLNMQAASSHRRVAVLLAGALLSLSTLSTQAAVITLSNTMNFHNQVVQVDFKMASAGTNIRIWTDSWLAGINFDPAAALWLKSGDDYSRLAEVDDDDTIAAGQGFYDTGFLLPTLAAGDYRLTLVAALNASNGTLLSQGFAYDGEVPIPLALWNQPSYDPNANDQKGGFWRLNLDGVGSVNLVSSPSTAWLLALTLPLLWLSRKRPSCLSGRAAASPFQ